MDKRDELMISLRPLILFRAVPENNVQRGETALTFRRDWMVGSGKKYCTGWWGYKHPDIVMKGTRKIFRRDWVVEVQEKILHWVVKSRKKCSLIPLYVIFWNSS